MAAHGYTASDAQGSMATRRPPQHAVPLPEKFRSSLKGLAATTAYRSSFKLHLLILGCFIFSQPVLAHFALCTKEVALLTALVNVPTILVRAGFHTWEDAESAQRAGAPMQVAYMLLKPMFLLGLAVQLFGIGSVPMLTTDLIRVAEMASPLLLMMDGILFATLGLSRTALVATIAVTASSFVAGGMFAAVPPPPPAEPTTLSPLAAFIGSMGLVAGALIGTTFSSTWAHQASTAELPARAQRGSGSGGGKEQLLPSATPLTHSTRDASNSLDVSLSNSFLNRPPASVSAEDKAAVEHTYAEPDAEPDAESTYAESVGGVSEATAVSEQTRLAAWECRRELERQDERREELESYMRGLLAGSAEADDDGVVSLPTLPPRAARPQWESGSTDRTPRTGAVSPVTDEVYSSSGDKMKMH